MQQEIVWMKNGRIIPYQFETFEMDPLFWSSG